IAKGIGAPIFHVNGDDPEAVSYVAKLAVEFRMRFRQDVVIDMVCYRKYGHNESDEPAFTQPVMYKAIREKQSPAQIYGQRLLSENKITQEEIDKLNEEYRQKFDRDYEAARSYKPNKADW